MAATAEAMSMAMLVATSPPAPVLGAPGTVELEDVVPLLVELPVIELLAELEPDVP